MSSTLKNAGLLTGGALIVSVVTQIVYMMTLGGADEPTHAGYTAYFAERGAEIGTVWMIELAAFTLVTVAALTALARQCAMPAAWAALALSGVFNAIQVAMGLSFFPAIISAGEEFFPLFRVVVAGAFFFYFLAKVLIGLAAAGFGMSLLRSAGIAAKTVGGLALLSGVAATIVNIIALPQGTGLVFPAGATGTAAAFIGGIAILMAVRQDTE
ncbi:hypothetical protein [Sphingorhabdus sp. Alg239-R122]|uniref:hypothetical protein n=1 Tax=Sphingorhabdus sp. Alg239-R122 TaxID=2305989 RepID=UPI0013D9ADA9|nr:hypothetical protein [Sphingorhabdus sp. Alg239-R122]